jgi:3-hydroxyacyl-[acyl-carrier-protein] dehydratase
MSILSSQALLDYIPQQAPFRFIDTILSVDDDTIKGQYTFKENESFYAGHFPGNPVTPGVILLETMAQTGVVAFGLYLLAKEKGEDELTQWLTFFSDANIEFLKPVKPLETVTISAKKLRWRRMKLRVSVLMTNEQGETVCEGEIAGMGVKKS